MDFKRIGDYPVINILEEQEGCYISYEESGRIGRDSRISLKLMSASGNVISQASSTVSVDKAMSALEKRVREKMNEEYDKNRPFETLSKEIKRINLLHERKRGSYPKVGGYSQPMVDWKVDENGKVKEVPVIINLGGAGNAVIQFDALKNSDWVSVSSQGISGFFLVNSIGKVLDAISSYLYVKKEIRTKEMEEKMKSSRSYKHQFEKAVKSAMKSKQESSKED